MQELEPKVQGGLIRKGGVVAGFYDIYIVRYEQVTIFTRKSQTACFKHGIMKGKI